LEDEEKKIIYNLLLSIQAQLQSLFYILGQDIEEKEDVNKLQEGCNHPKKHREVYTTMGSPEHWECKLCGYEYKEEKQKGR